MILRSFEDVGVGSLVFVFFEKVSKKNHRHLEQRYSDERVVKYFDPRCMIWRKLWKSYDFQYLKTQGQSRFRAVGPSEILSCWP